ncbi:MAG: glycosyltransferase family 2 protein [Bacteroidota bacterium]
MTPTVSVILPIRNEVSFIERGLGAVLAQDYPPDKVEVLVADGMSDDGTRAIVREVAARHPERTIRLIDNPARIVPTAMNRALAEAEGAVIVRVDGHAEIAPDYVRRSVEALEETGAACVGGVLRTVGETGVARAISRAQSSPFGVGGASFRTGVGAGSFVDTVAFGTYRREVFDRIGGFDEELIRNQDDELNFRLTQSGGKIWLDPSVRCVYFSRASLSKLWRQYYQYGLYKVRVMQKRGGLASWRHLVPAAFVLGLALSAVLALMTGQSLWLLAVAGPYTLANLGASLWTARGAWNTLPVLPVAFGILHLGYGLGFLAGLWRWRGQWKDKKILQGNSGLANKSC